MLTKTKPLLKTLHTARRDYHHRMMLQRLYNKYSQYTMINASIYVDNLLLAESVKGIKGDIVECGVWRGGMIAGIAEMLGSGRTYYLFDSFEGLPAAKEIDGEAAQNWQSAVDSPGYYNNCKAEMDFAEQAMNMTHTDYECIKGWFNETIPHFNKTESIGLLRLDGDWYESTWVCLEHFFPKVTHNGLVIIDDYYVWDGCSRAVHDYLSSIKSESRIFPSQSGVAYVAKQDRK